MTASNFTALSIFFKFCYWTCSVELQKSMFGQINLPKLLPTTTEAPAEYWSFWSQLSFGILCRSIRDNIEKACYFAEASVFLLNFWLMQIFSWNRIQRKLVEAAPVKCSGQGSGQSTLRSISGLDRTGRGWPDTWGQLKKVFYQITETKFFKQTIQPKNVLCWNSLQ